MKRVAVLLGMAVGAPAIASAQAPAQAPAPAVAPASPSSPPEAATSPVPAQGPGSAAVSAPAPTTGGPDSADATSADVAPKAAATPPGDQYYVEPPAGTTAPTQPLAFEPPLPPGRPIFEPPPPPRARHLAPKMSLWAGARLGWFFPFGNLWADAIGQGDGAYVLVGQPWSDYASSGPVVELDLGVRIARSYTVFALWERAQLGRGALNTDTQDGGDSDFWAVGLRATSNPDHLGFLTEVAIGFRRARTTFEDGTEYQFTEAPLEARLGLGAELRLNRMITISPLATIGVGAFGEVQSVDAEGRVTPLARGLDQNDGHAWATLMLGGHFDLLPSKN